MNLEILYGVPKKAKNKHMYIKSGTFSPPYKCRAGESSLSILKEKNSPPAATDRELCYSPLLLSI